MTAHCWMSLPLTTDLTLYTTLGGVYISQGGTVHNSRRTLKPQLLLISLVQLADWNRLSEQSNCNRRNKSDGLKTLWGVCYSSGFSMEDPSKYSYIIDLLTTGPNEAVEKRSVRAGVRLTGQMSIVYKWWAYAWRVSRQCIAAERNSGHLPLKERKTKDSIYIHTWHLRFQSIFLCEYLYVLIFIFV